MTLAQLLLTTGFYAVAFVAVALVTRATHKRAIGALAGGAAAGLFFLGAGRLGLALGLWTSWQPSTTGMAILLFVATALSLAPTFPITWRLARRFGWPGLAICGLAAGLIGPPREYLIASVYPDWVTFAPGIGPVLGVALTYAGMIAIGHTSMRLAVGPATGDDLAIRASGAPSN